MPHHDRVKKILFRLCCVICFFFLILVAYDVGFFAFHFAVFPSRLERIQHQNQARYFLFRNAKRTDLPPAIEPQMWLNIKPTYELFKSLRTSNSTDSRNTANILAKKCAKMKELDRLSDPECRAEWLHYLESAKIVAVGNMMGFALGKQAGFQVIFADGRKGLFKPCGSNKEWPENEVRASHLDYALGFHRAPPVVMRNISIEYLLTLQSQTSTAISSMIDHKQLIINTLAKTCAFDQGILSGAMIGWFSNLESAKTYYKKLLMWEDNPDYLNTIKHQFSRKTLGEITQNHFFFYLIDTLRSYGYNEYQLSTGELMTVDLDRARWNTKREPRITACEVCVVKVDTLEKLHESYEDGSLGYTLQHSLSYDPFQLIFTNSERAILDYRLSALIRCVNNCVRKGSKNVFVKPRGSM